MNVNKEKKKKFFFIYDIEMFLIVKKEVKG